MAELGAKPIIITVVGGVFMYSGFKNLTISETLRSLVSGQNPAKLAALQQKYNIAPTSPEAQALADGTAPSPTIIKNPGTPHGKGANYISPANIYRYARQAGFTATEAVIATAVALTESIGGNANAHCLNCVPGVTEDSRGLWQINVDAHPWALQGDLYDPATNAAAAFQVFKDAGHKFTPWSTYTSGSYLSHMGTALSASKGH